MKFDASDWPIKPISNFLMFASALVLNLKLKPDAYLAFLSFAKCDCKSSQRFNPLFQKI